MMRPSRSLLVAAVLLGACDNAGADRALGVTATGQVRGFVYFDQNGSGAAEATDPPFSGARIRLLAPVSRDTLLRGVTAADGTFRFDGVPVGSYALVIDSASAGDSARVRRVSLSTLTVHPDSTVEVEGEIGYPSATADEVRTLPLGRRVFLTGVALHARETYGDTLLHVVDTSGAIRASRVRPVIVAAGDSIRMTGRIAERLGQRLLDDVSLYVVGPTFIPTLPTVTTAAAASAAAGTLDAALVRIVNAGIVDTATVGGNLTMRVNDGSGLLTVVLDRASDAAFRPPFPAGLYVSPNRFDLIGVLVPTGTGAWRLRPRSSLDLTLR